MKKTFGFVVGAFVFLLGSNVYAAALGANVIGNVQVVGGVTATATSSVQSPGLVNVSGTVDLGVTGNATTSNNNDDNGQGLSADVAAGTVTSLDSASPDSIMSSDDLTAYDNLVVKARPSVTAVSQGTDGSVAVSYSQPAKFLGIFSTSVPAEIDVDATGKTTMSTPWWAFLYSKDDTSVQDSAAAAVQESGVQFGVQANALTTMQNQARVINAVSAAIQAQVSASANASAGTQ